MQRRPRPAVDYDVDRMQADMAERGWMQTDLARVSGLGESTVGRFLSGKRRTARTAKKLALALGYSIRRYLITRERTPQAVSA